LNITAKALRTPRNFCVFGISGILDSGKPGLFSRDHSINENPTQRKPFVPSWRPSRSLRFNRIIVPAGHPCRRPWRPQS
jgi:hypothetical protein